MSCKAVSSVCFQVLPCSWPHRNCAQKKVLGDHPGVSALPGHSGRALEQKQVRSSSSCWSCLLHNEHNPRRLFLQPVLRLVPCLEQSTSHPAPTTPHAVSRHTGSMCTGVWNSSFPLPKILSGHLKARAITTFCPSTVICCILSMRRVKPGTMELETARESCWSTRSVCSHQQQDTSLPAPGLRRRLVIPHATCCKSHLPACLPLLGGDCPAPAPLSPSSFLRSQSCSCCLLALALISFLPFVVSSDSPADLLFQS